jgi:thiol-disulfide isomerase/thioredoxin
VTQLDPVLPAGGVTPSFAGATGWLNSPPRTLDDLRGSVVLVEFWTYSCINWLRSHPYVRAWAQAYERDGLVVVGVHSPEFPFERDVDNVRAAAAVDRVTHPIALDNDYAVWRSFDNHYWPALYFLDAQGQIRHHHFGEGDYERSELAIRQLLAEAGLGGGTRELVSVDAAGAEAPADWDSLGSPETYLGYERAANFASPGGADADQRRVYTAPERLRPNHWALAGEWTVGAQSVALHAAGGRFAYQFHARDLHLVMGPAERGRSVRFRLRLDGRPPGDAHGVDVDGQGDGVLTDPRLYQLIRQPGPVADRLLEIEFLDPGAQAYVVTFG